MDLPLDDLAIVLIRLEGFHIVVTRLSTGAITKSHQWWQGCARPAGAGRRRRVAVPDRPEGVAPGDPRGAGSACRIGVPDRAAGRGRRTGSPDRGVCPRLKSPARGPM